MIRTLILSVIGLSLMACSPAPPTRSVPSTSDSVDTKEAPIVRGPTGSASRAVIPHAQLPNTISPSAYRIDMVIDPKQDGMTGRVEIDATVNEATDGFWIHAKDMDVTGASFTIGERLYPLSFDAISLSEAPSGLAWMASETPLPAGSGVIRMDYSTPYNQNLNSAYKVVRGDDAYIVTQMEPLGAREAFPGFDEPRFKQPFTLSITAPDGNVVVSNTPKTVELPLGDNLIRHEFAQTKPLATYLIAFAVGPYDVVEFDDLPPNDVRDRPLAFRGIAARGEGKRLFYALENTNGLLTALEEYFGIPYPYEKLDLIAAPDYAFGAMENPGLIVYREYLLLLDDDAPLSQKRAYARVHSHELAHQWFGNLVTPVWWEDIWLNEAFATWMGNKGLTLWQPEGNFENVTLNASLGAMNIDSLASTRSVREPLLRSERVMDQFDSITYRKGGGVLDMFESFVGEDAFQAGIRLHMDRYADSVATADDFFQSIADGSGNPDVVSAMKSFVDQPGLPLVTFESNGADVTITQSRYAPLGSSVEQGQIWQIPIVMKGNRGLGTVADGAEIHEFKGLLTTRRDRFESKLGTGPDRFLMPNANGAGYYRFNLDAEGWTKLLDNLDQLNTREVLSTQDSLIAAFRAGTVSADTFLKGMQAFAQHPDYDVASKSTQLLGFVYSQFPEARDGLAAYVQDTYSARYQETLGTETIEGSLLAPTLGGLLARLGDDSAVKAELLSQARLYLDLDEGERSDVRPNSLGSAFDVLMREQPELGFDPLLNLAATGSPLEKSAALGALTETPLADQARRLLTIALDSEGPITGRQAGSLINGLLYNDAHSELVWSWYRENFADYITARVPDVRRGRVPLLAGGFCSEDKRNEVEAFYRRNARLIPGFERSLAQVQERISLCAALKSAQGESLVAALTRDEGE